MAVRGLSRALRYTAASLAIASIATTGSNAQRQAADAQSIAFDIAPGPLQTALATFGSRTGWQLIYSPRAVAGHQVEGLHERLSPHAALEKLIANTGLRIRQIGSNIIVLETPRADAEPVDPPPGQPTSAAPPFSESLADPDASAQADHQEIVVTGSNIHGGKSPVGSYVRTMTRAEIDRNGYGTVAQALQALPGNFGGVATEQSSLAFVDHTASNATLSTGVNLRGLGADATLVLINGHRIAGSGNLGDFADISNIPLSIVDRIEILMDGASAIYGSDAVGGVVNIIMKDHFDGLESGGRIGTVTHGGMREFEAYQNAGKDWGTGNVLLSYEYYEQKPLMDSDRRFSMTADSRPLGGTDHRTIYSLPGNILGYDADGTFGATYAIPTGQDGTALRPDDFIPGKANLGDPLEGAYLIPRQVRHSIYASAHQDIGDNVHLSLEGRFTRRDFETLSGGYVTILTVTQANPWFVSPTGDSSDLIGYDFGQELGPTRDSGWSQSLGFTGSLDADLPKGWKLSSYASYAQSRERHVTDHIANEAILSEALGTTPDDPATSYSPARDGYFNPYGDGSSNSPAVLNAIGGAFLDARNADYVSTGNVQLDGPLFDLPAGAVRIAIGANVRREVFDSEYTSYYDTTTPVSDPPAHYGRTIEAAFAEARVPLFGPANALPGVRRLDLSLAGRVERYPDFGTTANPKVGVTWTLVEGLSLRGTYGTSFRAPNLSQLYSPVAVATTTLANASGASLPVLDLGGGNPDLKPETARSWTIGADIAPSSLPGLRLNATLFRTIFDHRIDRPVARDFYNALVNPDLAPFVRFVSPTTNAADRAYLDALIASFGGSGQTFPVDHIAAVVDTRYVNTASTDVRGLDFTVGYTAKRGPGTVSVNANATYLLAWKQKTTPTSAVIDERNLSGQPAAFKGRLTTGWQQDGWDAQVGLNYVNRYRDAVTGARIRSWTTVDARVAWTAPKASWLDGMSFALAAQNLFDRDPPFYDSAAGVGYDAANSDATGRFVSLQISKRW